MSFEKLMSELQSLESEQDNMLKALPAGEGEDERIQAAAEEGGMLDEADPDLEREAEDEDEEEEEFLGKSLGLITLEDGSQVEGYDGTELVKSLMDQVDKLGSKQTKSERQMASALEKCVNLIRSQGDLIKSMQDRLERIGGEPRGRKSVVSVVEKPGTTMAKSEENGMDPKDFMLKAHSAFEAGKISGHELTTLDVALRMGAKVDTEIIQKVLS